MNEGVDFYQDTPVLPNTYTRDPVLKDHLKRVLPSDVHAQVSKHLEKVGALAAGDWLKWSREAERAEPVLVAFDSSGRRIDEVRLSPGWRALEAAAAQEGIVASGYERTYGEYSRVYQMALLYLFHASSAFVSCPLAMTDGAARAIELYGDDDLKSRALKHLTSRDPVQFWTSGQWMTEKTGGSDVSMTSTEALPAAVSGAGDSKFPWGLHGVKWFTSAATSAMALALARTPGAAAGSKGLSLFYVETRDAQGHFKNIEVLRLKDKLGTRAMPTTEMRLTGAQARLMAGEGDGVRKVSTLLNITRIYNSVCAVSHLRRALTWAELYSKQRFAFGRNIGEHPLHRATLAEQERKWRRGFDLTFFVAHLLGRDEVGTASADDRILLRVLTPIVKMVTAKAAMSGTSEALEAFGGLGYIEESGMPTLLRDAQVFSIWEGTTNILALDFLRALSKDGGARVLHEALIRYAPASRTVAGSLAAIATMAPADAELRSRSLAFEIAEALTETSGNLIVPGNVN